MSLPRWFAARLLGGTPCRTILGVLSACLVPPLPRRATGSRWQLRAGFFLSLCRAVRSICFPANGKTNESSPRSSQCS